MTTPETMRRFTGELTTAQKPQETLGGKFKLKKKAENSNKTAANVCSGQKPPQMLFSTFLRRFRTAGNYTFYFLFF
jgi:hypothetical protein